MADGKPEKKDGAEGLRAAIRAAISEDATLDGVRQIVADVLQTEMATKVTCPGCGMEHKVVIPDAAKQATTLISLLEQAEGKAETKPQEATRVVIERPPRT